MKKITLVCLALAAPIACLFELTRSFVFGWILFLYQTLPRMTVDRPSVLVGCLALVLFLAGIHAAGRAWRRRAPQAKPWKFRWSLAAITTVFLLFAAGISFVAIVHQTGWLITSRQPTYVQTIRSDRFKTSRDNLREVGSAASNYGATSGTFSGGTFSLEGRMLHSWETRTLVFLSEPAYSSADIDFKIPWNYPRNARYFQCIIPQFINRDLESPSLFDGRSGFGLSHYAANVRVVGPNTNLRLADIRDGAANTLLIGEVNADFKPWGHPVNWRDPAKGINRSRYGFGGAPSAGGAYFSMADGSVRFVSERINPSVLRALSTPAGGEAIDASVLGSAP